MPNSCGNPENEYLPSLYNENSVAYTGTHDNDTLRSFIERMDKTERKAFEQKLEQECLDADVAYVTETIEDECKSVIELLFASKANVVILPMHDTKHGSTRRAPFRAITGRVGLSKPISNAEKPRG